MRTLTRTLGLLLLLLSLPAVAHEGLPQVWAESPMVKVRPETPPRVQPSLQLVAARNEFVGLEHLTEEEVEAVRKQCESDAGEAERGERDMMPSLLARSFERIRRTSHPR